MSRKISYSRGRGKLRHNNRDIVSKNVDKERIEKNITLVKEDLGEAYRTVFGEAQAAYNAKQKRADRRIDDYFKKLFGREPTDTILKNDNKQQSFYEYVVGVGDMNDTGFASNPEMAQKSVECLREYMEDFIERNPNFYVFNAVIHCDEATPHLHYDFIPFANGYKTGMSQQQGIAKALEQMGYGKREKAYINFTQSERQAFREICEAHGIEVADEQKGRGFTFTTEQYREQAELQKQNAALLTQYENLQEQNDKLSEEKDVKIKQTISDFVSGKGAKKVAAAEKIIDNAEALNAANLERENQLADREQALKKYAVEQEHKAQHIVALQRETESKINALENDRKALETERKSFEAEKKSFEQAVAIKARQIADKILRAMGIKTNTGHDIDSQIRLAVQQERSKQWKER